jgi:hypothetical protein
MAYEHGGDNPARPVGCGGWEELEGDENGEGPDLGDETDEEALI